MPTQRENFSHLISVDGDLSEGGLVDQSSVVDKERCGFFRITKVPNQFKGTLKPVMSRFYKVDLGLWPRIDWRWRVRYRVTSQLKSGPCFENIHTEIRMS